MLFPFSQSSFNTTFRSFGIETSWFSYSVTLRSNGQLSKPCAQRRHAHTHSSTCKVYIYLHRLQLVSAKIQPLQQC